jgi:predicted ArsR family transcriptional regulator
MNQHVAHDLFSYPTIAGAKGGAETSQAAAASINAAGLRAKVLKALRNLGDATADEAADYLKIDKLSIRPRFSELQDMGKVVQTRCRRMNESGRSAVVWRLA